MASDTKQSIEERLNRLERQNRKFKAGFAVFALLFGALVLMGQVPKNRTVEANKFVLLDSQGRARVTIGTPSSSGIAVGLRPDEPAIWITDEKGQDRAILNSDGLRFADQRGK